MTPSTDPNIATACRVAPWRPSASFLARAQGPDPSACPEVAVAGAVAAWSGLQSAAEDLAHDESDIVLVASIRRRSELLTDPLIIEQAPPTITKVALQPRPIR